MSAIVIVDTSVLLNILDVPGRNQDLDLVLAHLARMIDDGDHLFIPMAAIIETGNHIGHVDDGALRRAAAERFTDEIRRALANEAPWKPINFPSSAEVLLWLEEFPDAAMRGLGMGDLAIRHEYETLCTRHPMSVVRVWTLDGDLAGLERVP